MDNFGDNFMNKFVDNFKDNLMDDFSNTKYVIFGDSRGYLLFSPSWRKPLGQCVSKSLSVCLLS